MAITIQLAATSDITIVADNDIIFDGKTVEFYKASSHQLKFTGHTQGAPGSASGWISAICSSANKKIHLAGSSRDKIPLYYAVGNGEAWATATYYNIGDLVWGDDATTNKHLWRCKAAHSSLADTRPPTGIYSVYYWDQRDDLDNGEKYVYINNWS